MNEFKTFIKNENENWEEYKNLINEDTKFMMRDEDGTEIEMTPREVINQLYQDNKTLEHYINNLQSKIDKAIEYIEEHTDKLGKIKIPKIDFNYNELSDILKEVE